MGRRSRSVEADRRRIGAPQRNSMEPARDPVADVRRLSTIIKVQEE